MNTTQLFAQIDTEITNKVGINSITKVAVANQIKAVVNFAKVKTLKYVISHAELLAIFTSPIQILEPIINKCYIPTNVLLRFIDNNGWSGASGSWQLLRAEMVVAAFATQIGSSTTKEQLAFSMAGNPNNTNGTFFNKGLTFTATSNPVGPNNALTTVEVYVSYIEIDL